MRFSISEVSSAASGSSTRHGTLKSAGMTPSAASSCNALSRLPPAVTAWTPFSPAEGWTTRFCFKPRARMLAFSSASSAAEGGVLRTLVGDGTSLSSGMFRTADGVVVMGGYSATGGQSLLSSYETRTTLHPHLSLSFSAKSAASIMEPQCRNLGPAAARREILCKQS